MNQDHYNEIGTAACLNEANISPIVQHPTASEQKHDAEKLARFSGRTKMKGFAAVLACGLAGFATTFADRVKNLPIKPAPQAGATAHAQPTGQILAMLLPDSMLPLASSALGAYAPQAAANHPDTSAIVNNLLVAKVASSKDEAKGPAPVVDGAGRASANAARPAGATNVDLTSVSTVPRTTNAPPVIPSRAKVAALNAPKPLTSAPLPPSRPKASEMPQPPQREKEFSAVAFMENLFGATPRSVRQ